MCDLQLSSKQLKYYNTLGCAGIHVIESPTRGQLFHHCTSRVRARGLVVDGFCGSCNGRAICAPLGPDVYNKHAALFEDMLLCTSMEEAAGYHERIGSSTANIRQLFTDRELVPVYKCPAIDVPSAGASSSSVRSATILVKSGYEGDGPRHEYTFQYTFCPAASKFRAGEGHLCCLKHMETYTDLIVNHDQLGSDYKAACESVNISKQDFFQLHGSVTDAWIQYEGQEHYTGLQQRAQDTTRQQYLMLAPRPADAPVMSAREAAHIDLMRKRRLEIQSKSSASRARQLQAADIGGAEVDQPAAPGGPQGASSASGSHVSAEAPPGPKRRKVGLRELKDLDITPPADKS